MQGAFYGRFVLVLLIERDHIERILSDCENGKSSFGLASVCQLPINELIGNLPSVSGNPTYQELAVGMS